MQKPAKDIAIGDRVMVHGRVQTVIERTDNDTHVYIVYERGQDGRRVAAFPRDEVVIVRPLGDL